MNYQYILYEKKGRVAYITMNRPESMNALNADCHVEMSDAFNDFAADPETWVAILTGAGDRAFSAGNDLKATAAQFRDGGGGAQRPARQPKGGFGGITSRFDLFKPVIAAVNGWAVGGGCEMMLACDIVVAAEHARFGLPEPKRGLLAGAGGVHRLPRKIPVALAMGMILTGKDIDASTALSYGLINEVVPKEELMAAAERWAAEICACAPISVRASKEAAMVGLDLPLEVALRRSYDGQQEMMASDDFIEGPRAFAEKREPQWKNG